MSYAIRFVMAWTCFGIGTAAYRIADFVHDLMPQRFENGRFAEKFLGAAYLTYTKFAVWSDYWQGDTTAGPWRPVADDQHEDTSG
jgi:hypothetical protein